ncbi:RUN domain-containing protein 1-like [Palaemon carinicauda]|uniref:RUN domain-containing protein 1-like n=1 Tax=Palaemon carinicauda TaxID=392227 RepID=UPI0035B5E9DB
MTTENECLPNVIGPSAFLSGNPANGKCISANSISDKDMNFADFDRMNKDLEIQNYIDHQRKNEISIVVGEKEVNDLVKAVSRTSSFDRDVHCSADSCLKDKEFESLGCDLMNPNSKEEESFFERGFEKNYDDINVRLKNLKSADGKLSDNVGQLESYSPRDFGDDEWDSDGRPTGERWPPLGAPDDDEDNRSLYSCSEYSWSRRFKQSGEEERLQQLEEEQEQLTNSLMSLTSHFAQVQFRLKQIVDASPNEKEALLQELEEFANRGIPDLREATISTENIGCKQECADENAAVARQKELIEKLKQQLEDLENYAYQTGEGGPPQSKVMEKQRVIIEQLKGKLNLNVDEFEKLTVDDLRNQVDHAICELVNPLKMKEQLIAQLQTQITDLERFVHFLQGEAGESTKTTKCGCKEMPHRHPGVGRSHEADRKQGRSGAVPSKSSQGSNDKEQLRKETEHIMKRATILLNMLSFGCGTNHHRFQKNTLKKTPQGNHYGDLRAALEVAINNVLEILGPQTPADSDYTSDSEEVPVISYHEELVIAVRKQLAPALRDLMQHGLMPVGQSQSLVPFLSCFPQRSQKATKLLHAWDLILKYYQLKKGDQYNRTPARRLSQSFNLEITGGSALTSKQALLSTIGSIITSHTPLKRSYDSHFKAFVCSALNQKKLITWLRLIFRTQVLTENYYQSWSYVGKTGFEDSFRSLERLNKYNLDLPVDLAVQPFQNIKDAF